MDQGSSLRKTRIYALLAVFLLSLLAGGGLSTALAAKGGIPGKPAGEDMGNNLSFPVLWAEGIAKPLPGTSGTAPVLDGAWWYWWGTAPEGTPLSCAPDPDQPTVCEDGSVPGDGWLKAYLQKDSLNVWQAGNEPWSEGGMLSVDRIDWGDNLESVDWYTRSKVRTEVVLYKDLPNGRTLTEYEMRHVDGWGINEVHGLAEDPVLGVLQKDGSEATVYSHCARLTIQKLLVPRDDPALEALEWSDTQWSGDNLVNEPIFNFPVYDDVPQYAAEINVKGKVIYGYTWDVRKLNDTAGGSPAGDYRITFSFDDPCGTIGSSPMDVSFAEIMLPIEEETLEIVASKQGGDSGGATAVVDRENNLTYIDVRILQ